MVSFALSEDWIGKERKKERRKKDGMKEEWEGMKEGKERRKRGIE